MGMMLTMMKIMRPLLTYFTILITCSALIGAELYNSPPQIFLPDNLDKPENLTIIGNNSHVVNVLRCAARNADEITWRYRKILNGNDQSIPLPFSETKNIVDGVAYSTLTDSDNDWRLRDELNGYYVCYARNNKFKFQTITPPIRFILPDISRDAAEYAPRSMVVNVQHPLRLKCVDDNIPIKPKDLHLWNVARYSWQKFTPRSGVLERKVTEIRQDSRIRIDRRTGDLYFAYVKNEDHTGTRDFDPEYQCMISLGVKPKQYTASRYHLDVLTANEPVNSFMLQVPEKNEVKKVDCIDGKECPLSCIYGGRKDERDPPPPKWTEKGSVVTKVYGNTVLFTATEDAAGEWKCQLDDNTSPVGRFDVTVLSYPRILSSDMESKYVEVGSDVIFTCNAQPRSKILKIEFFVNGKRLQPGAPAYVDYTEGDVKFKVFNAQRNASSSVACMAYSKAGVSYKAAELNVYDKPVVLVTPESGLQLSKQFNKSLDELKFTCSVSLDPKVLKANVHWRSNLTSIQEEKLLTGHPIGIKSIISTDYVDNKMSSVLTFEIDSETQNTIKGGMWWCIVEMTLYGKDEPILATSNKVPFGIPIPSTGGLTTAGAFGEWWIIGVIVAVVFFILIIVLIICCVKHHQGEEYYVDEKERKAGHDPIEELDHYKFHDYKRPATGGYMPIHTSDQDPIKGSSLSLNNSDKPIDSDHGSMDQYGDIDVAKFNEDGSFIGKYGKSSQLMDV